MERIYLDHGATTGVAKEVLEKMMPYFSEVFGNGSSQHFFGREALEAIDNARELSRLSEASPKDSLQCIYRERSDIGVHVFIHLFTSYMSYNLLYLPCLPPN